MSNQMRLIILIQIRTTLVATIVDNTLAIKVKLENFVVECANWRMKIHRFLFQIT